MIKMTKNLAALVYTQNGMFNSYQKQKHIQTDDSISDPKSFFDLRLSTKNLGIVLTKRTGWATADGLPNI